MPLQVAPVHVVGKSVVGGEKEMDGIEFVGLREGRSHVREGPVELTGGGVGGLALSPPGARHGADVPQALAVRGGSSDVSPRLLETFL